MAVVRRPSDRPVPDATALAARLEEAARRLEGSDLASLSAAAELIESVDGELRGSPGVRCLLGDRAGLVAVEHHVGALQPAVDRIEAELDAGSAAVAPGQWEAINAAVVRLKDAVWAVGRDRLRNARAVADLAGPDAGPAALEAFASVQVALSALDRLEVRGRDSAGLHVLVRDHGLDLGDPAIARLLEERAADPLFGSRSARSRDGCLSLVYKAAAEIGELGDNTAAIRAAMRDDTLLQLALSADSARAVVLAHTRWASVGIISEPNAHPLNQEEQGRADGPYVTAALNGDVDNYADLKAVEALDIPSEITTDAKVIPTLVSRRAAGASLEEAFRATVSGLEGSVAIAAQSAVEPEEVLLALRGSGQALYVGLAEDCFVVASEPYGLVEETPAYLRMDGETPVDPARASATRGQIIVLDTAGAGTVDGIRRVGYDGTVLPVAQAELQRAEITTRDIDRGAFPHFFLKEISEAPTSFRKTLRGKIADESGRLRVALGPETLPDGLAARLRDGTIRRVVVIGQGTAAIAGHSLAAALAGAAGDALTVSALPATELSGFGLRDDMSDTLVVAISQSGTTTDTNRTIDLARARNAAIVSIVNRRNSDIVDRSDGVLFTSDGRDVEMSVASTKAFYSQIAAGSLLALALAREAGAADDAREHELLTGLRALPDAMHAVVGRRAAIAEIAQRHAPSHRYWAVVGNGANRIAASEIRIKLSELCYKSISCDVTEDKKHIDLSAEPMVLVCAPGLSGSNADDVAKEVEIYRAHRATPLVIATEGEQRFQAAVETITVPEAHPALGFVLATVAGHLFGYEAALAIDASALPMRQARMAIEAEVSRGGAGAAPELRERLGPELEAPSARYFDGLRAGGYDGHLEASTAVRLVSLLRYATGGVSLDSYQVEHGKVGTPSTVVEDLTAALTQGIGELTRPVDAIKHQAKTVTVGISRSDETLLQVPLVREVLGAGVARDSLSYRALRTLADLEPAVEHVTGFTRYRIEGDLAGDDATVHVVDRGGISADLPSRTDRNPVLRGTKHRVATEREVTVARGRFDQRTMIIVPEVKGTQTTGLTLLHVAFRDRLAPEAARGVLQGYRGRYAALKDVVTETEPAFDDARLADFDVVDLLTEPVAELADRWSAR
ncbi:MAG: SIS domain-containing protein [Actinomycetota bacterium]